MCPLGCSSLGSSVLGQRAIPRPLCAIHTLFSSKLRVVTLGRPGHLPPFTTLTDLPAAVGGRAAGRAPDGPDLPGLLRARRSLCHLRPLRMGARNADTPRAHSQEGTLFRLAPSHFPLTVFHFERATQRYCGLTRSASVRGSLPPRITSRAPLRVGAIPNRTSLMPPHPTPPTPSFIIEKATMHPLGALPEVCSQKRSNCSE